MKKETKPLSNTHPHPTKRSLTAPTMRKIPLIIKKNAMNNVNWTAAFSGW